MEDGSQRLFVNQHQVNMTPPANTLPSLWTLRPPIAAVHLLLLLMTSLPVSGMEPETCFSRQHQSAIVNVRQALNRTTTAMAARVVRSERDCVLACCSEDVKPGAKCNMAVFNANKHAGEDNCFLFHCQTEQDCPLMKAQDGTNTYDIYKGLIHPTTVRPLTMTTTTEPTTTTSTTPATTTPTTPQPTTTSPTTTTTTTTTQAPATTTAPPFIIIIATMPPVTPAPTTTTTTTTTTTAASTTTSTAATTTKKPNKTSKKQNKTAKKVKPHPVGTITSTRPTQSSTTSLPVVTAKREAAPRTSDKPLPTTETTTTTTPTTTAPAPTTTTTTTTTTTPATTTTTTSTTTTTIPATTTSTTTTTPATTTTTTPLPATTTTTDLSTTKTTPPASLVIVPKGAVQSDQALQNSSADRGKSATSSATRGALKSGVVAFTVLGLAVLTLALAVGGRKAMESFDRRHYTRLELNDLHYEV